MSGPVETVAYAYDLPPEQIAQHPLPDRDASRLLVLDRSCGGLEHRTFRDVEELICPEDVVVINTSRVMRARLRGQRASGAPAELLLLRPHPDGSWLALGHPGGKLKPGRTVRFGPEAVAEIVDVLGGGVRRIRWRGSLSAWEVMRRYGETPLPPYITRRPGPEDEARYQTVFADQPGSAAAPTAGLHFTPGLLRALERRGTQVVPVDLAIGLGTFKPVACEDVRDHVMHTESYVLPEETGETITRVRAEGGRCWAVGTTVVRTLESAARTDGTLAPGAAETDLFIRPPYTFRIVDKLLTNFHLPCSTLLMLVAALGGYEAVMRAYCVAVESGYRFYSYGDAMAVI